MSHLKWGILGTGMIANVMAQAILESKNNHLIAIASRSENKAKQFAIKYQCSHYFSDYYQLLHCKDIIEQWCNSIKLRY